MPWSANPVRESSVCAPPGSFASLDPAFHMVQSEHFKKSVSVGVPCTPHGEYLVSSACWCSVHTNMHLDSAKSVYTSG
eukprot:scaffold108145_cov19-Tisochrysis_lutea.AAC.1